MSYKSSPASSVVNSPDKGSKYHPHNSSFALDNFSEEELFDIPIVCRDCKEEFSFTISQQKSHQAKGYANMPSRCKKCKAKKKFEEDCAKIVPYRHASEEIRRKDGRSVIIGVGFPGCGFIIVFYNF